MPAARCRCRVGGVESNVAFINKNRDTSRIDKAVFVYMVVCEGYPLVRVNLYKKMPL